jgi:UDPglucose 6-dehydrogenase
MCISVVGTGYVGLVSAVCFAEKGIKVICVDKNHEKIEKLNNGIMPIYEEGLEEICKKNHNLGMIEFTTDLKYAVENSSVIFIAVATPALNDGRADLTQVIEVVKGISKYINGYKVIVNKSTVPVGTQKLVKDIINNVNVDVVSNPEFLREGSAIYDTMNPDRIIIGSESKKSSNIMMELYNNFNAPVISVSPESAEMIKYASNTFLALKVSYINEIANICEIVGAEIIDVAKGMGMDKRIGNKFLNAGIGFGGACFPKDVQAIYQLSKENDYDFKLAKSLFEINESQKTKPVEKLMNIMNYDITGINVAVLGLAFKPNTDDMRGAPSIKIIEQLKENGANIKAYDPFAIENAKAVLDAHIYNYNNLYDTLVDVDAIIVCTEWDDVITMEAKEVSKLVRNKIIIDGRNCLNKEEFKMFGFSYYGIGMGDNITNQGYERNIRSCS